MNEDYLGPDADRVYISHYLENIRTIDPVEISTISNCTHLADADRIPEIVDAAEFWQIIARCLVECERLYGIKLVPVKPERYYTSFPSESSAIGGFHDPQSLGYQFWYQASFVVSLNGTLISRKLRTIELARSYLHDCLHHSTFRSFRRAMRIPAPSASAAKHRVPEIYREQYGINFRNQDGDSYSSPDLTSRSPLAINLNLLMDGIVVMTTAKLLGSAIKNDIAWASPLETELEKEIFLRPFDPTTLPPRAHQFNEQVTEPSKVFVEHWGGDHFITIVLHAMKSGALKPLKKFFADRTGQQNAWETIFRDPDFTLPADC